MIDLQDQIFSVSELTNTIKFTLENSFDKISVEGEISNFKNHVSGHWYFNLKDEGAVINCTMWKGVNNYVFFKPADGMKIIVSGRITVYPPRGSYQIDVRSMKTAGIGELQAAFERLKKKLLAEGLFDTEYKKTFPQFPKKIGIVTAVDGAAIKDMISVAQRRFPLAELVIVPTKVQGAGAAENIAANIGKLNYLKDIDVIIIARGGGTIEDLWAFNEEIVARAIFKSKIPIVSGVGHEIDFTIADFVSDLRAPTPSVAMELVTPDVEEIKSFIMDSYSLSCNIIDRTLENLKSEIDDRLNSYVFRYPFEKIRKFSQMVDLNIFKLNKQIEHKIISAKNKIMMLNSLIESHNIERTLQKGFVLIKQNSKFVMRKKNYNSQIPAVIKFYDGEEEIK